MKTTSLLLSAVFISFSGNAEAARCPEPSSHFSSAVSYIADPALTRSLSQILSARPVARDATNASCESLYQVAIRLRNNEALEQLEGLGFAPKDLNETTAYGMTSFEYALAFGDLPLIQKMASRGGVNPARYGRDALMIAAMTNTASVVQGLIRSGGNVHAVDSYGATALMLAAQTNSADVVRVLLNAGADPRAVDQRKKTALIYATSPDDRKKEPTSVVEELLKAGADVNAVGNNGISALSLAAQLGSVSTAKVLLQAGAEIESVDPHDGRTPLLKAVFRRDFAMVNLLVDSGAKVEVVDSRGESAMLTALKRYEWGVLNALIRGGARLRVTEQGDHTALMVAAKYHLFGAVYVLRNAGADPHVKDKNGQNALMLAVQMNFGDVVNAGVSPSQAKEIQLQYTIQMLDKMGVDLRAKDAQGRTAYDLAVAKGHPQGVLGLLRPIP